MKKAAELVSTGAELLSGRSTNTHARLLGERLGRLGIVLSRDTTVPDDLDVIRDAVRDAARRVDLVFISGGLGPTNDDVTRDALAALLNRPVIMDPASLAQLREKMRRAGRALNPARERQARIVEGAEALPNSAGAAPGERIECEGKTYFVLPGPPIEFRAILDEHIMPWLTRKLGGPQSVRERVILTQGIGEADMIERFEAAGFPPPGVTTAYCASAGRVELRLHPLPDTPDDQLDQAADHAAALLGDFVYARKRIELEVLVATHLTGRGHTLATAESCTGGLIGARLTSASGSSTFYRGGVVAYADIVKRNLLGVPDELLQRDGAVSEPVARAMADGARAAFKTDYALAVTGIAGPSGGSPDKPVGLVFIALAGPAGTRALRHVFVGNREMIRESACRAALRMLLDTPAANG